MLHTRFIDIVKSLREKKININMETNGTLINKENAKVIKDNIAFTSVSLDSPTKEFHDKLKDIASKAPKLEKVYSIDQIDGVPNWMEIISLGRANAAKLERKPCQ